MLTLTFFMVMAVVDVIVDIDGYVMVILVFMFLRVGGGFADGGRSYGTGGGGDLHVNGYYNICQDSGSDVDVGHGSSSS